MKCSRPSLFCAAMVAAQTVSLWKNLDIQKPDN